MRIRSLTVFAILVCITLTAVSASAFNGERKGFILGFGLGPAWSSAKEEVEGLGAVDRESKFGIASDFKIGAGVNDQLMIYYVNRVAWIKEDTFSDRGELMEDITIASSVGLLGASYYLTADAPSWYVVGAVGISSWSAPFESNSEMFTGFGVTGGLGYEFAKHWSLEATLNWGKPSKTINGTEVKVDAFSVLVTVCGLAF